MEESYDWYAQDRGGTVWCLGEDSRELEDGRVVVIAESWDAGRNDARPGITMLEEPSWGCGHTGAG